MISVNRATVELIHPVDDHPGANTLQALATPVKSISFDSWLTLLELFRLLNHTSVELILWHSYQLSKDSVTFSINLLA